MGRLILIAIVLVGAGFAWRVFRRQQRRVVEALRQAEAVVKKSAPETLVKDPVTGIYRPTDRRE